MEEFIINVGEFIYLLCLFGIAVQLIFFIYFMPSYIAIHRNLKRNDLIYHWNIFTGWTVIGWVICLFWALIDNDKVKKSAEETTEGAKKENEL